jgi:hypothetical protein
MNIIKNIVFIALLLTIIQQFPYVRENYYSQIRILLYLFFGIFSFIGIFISKPKLTLFIKVFFVCTLLWYLLMVIFYITGLNFKNPYNTSNDILEPVIPLGLLVLAYKFNFSDNEIKKFSIIYIIFVTIMGIANIVYYGIGLEIPKIYIENFPKNQIGPILSISSIICFYLFLNNIIKRKSFAISYIYIIFKIINLICLALIRNRSGLLATFIIITFLILFYYKYIKKNTKVYLNIIAIFVILVFLDITTSIFNSSISFLYNSFTANYNISDMDNLSAGRVKIYEIAIIFLKNNFFLGELNSSEYVPGIAHNYLLNKVVKYGLIGSIPLIFLYLYIVIFIFKTLLKQIKLGRNINLSLLLIWQAIIISFFEYSYPYGPGVSQALSWFLLGQYLSRTFYEKMESRNEGICFIS